MKLKQKQESCVDSLLALLHTCKPSFIKLAQKRLLNRTIREIKMSTLVAASWRSDLKKQHRNQFDWSEREYNIYGASRGSPR